MLLVTLQILVLASLGSSCPMLECVIGQSLPDLHSIMADYPDITEFQFESRVDDVVGNMVSGHGEVEDVGSLDFMDYANAPDGYEYKVILALNGDNQTRAVVFLISSTGLGSINIGDEFYFTGQIIDITDWGFWFTAYIKGD